MTAVLIIGIILSSVLIAMGIIAASLVAIIRGKRSVFRVRGGTEQLDETRLIQELHEGLLKMEKRVEALEIILLKDKRKEDANDNAG